VLKVDQRIFQAFGLLRLAKLFTLNISIPFPEEPDFKGGGYHLAETNVEGDRLIALVLLIAIAYTAATISGQKIKRWGIEKYVGRVKP
jgi:hypothetical protein